MIWKLAPHERPQWIECVTDLALVAPCVGGEPRLLCLHRRDAAQVGRVWSQLNDAMNADVFPVPQGPVCVMLVVDVELVTKHAVAVLVELYVVRIDGAELDD